MNLKRELTLLLKGEVEDNKDVLKKYARDASAFEVWPQIVVFPKDVEDIKKLVQFVSNNKKNNPSLSMSVRGGGSGMTGGSLTESIVIDITKHLKTLKKIDTQKRIATVEPGMFYHDFEKETLKRNLFMPSYPASRELCTIGGMVANNAGGEKSLAYGKTENFVEQIKVILADGNEYTIGPLNKDKLKQKMNQGDPEGALYRSMHTLIEKNKTIIQDAKPNVAKNSAGYYLWNIWGSNETFNLAKIIVGSQGTLGIVTEITLKLIKPKPHKKMLVIFMRDLSLVPSLVSKLLPFEPESLESYDDKTLGLVLRYFPGFVRLMGVKNLLKLSFQFLPEAKITLTRGFPHLVILAEFTGSDRGKVEERVRMAEKEMKKLDVATHMVKSEDEAKKYWTIRREAFNLIRNHLENEKSLPFIDDVVVRPEKLPEFFPELFNILEPYKKHVRFAIGGHSGSGNFHIYTIVKKNDVAIKNIIPKVSKKVYDLVVRLGGSITAEHNDGLIRSPFLKSMYGKEVVSLFEQTKDIFDPQNIMNPGKKVYASWDYALNHIKTE